MGTLKDHLKYEVKLYELENGQWNYYVFASTRVGNLWQQPQKIGYGTAINEAFAVRAAQEEATIDRSKRPVPSETPYKIVTLK